MDTPTLLTHLQTPARPLTLPRGGALCWDDAGLHRAAYTDDPEAYALLGLAPGVAPWQRARVLLQVLAASQAGLDDHARLTLAKAARVLTLALPPAHVITVLLALRRLRANHKHTTRAVLRFILEHPGADALIAARRPALLDCFEHALGKATARGCARRIADGDTASDHLQRRLLRFLTAPGIALPRVTALYGAAPAADGARGNGADPHGEPVLHIDALRERPPTVTPTNRGDIAATLVHLYRGGPAEDLYVALGGYVGAAAGAFPRFEGTLAMVLDASASMRGYGEREWAVLSQAAALRMVLSQVCDRLEVVEIGGDERTPHGPTDLATGVLDALATAPDLVAVVSDGYENLYPGDLARVVATLPRAGITTPVVFCHAMFTDSDDLSLRRPAPALPQRGFWHQDDFAELLPWMFGHCGRGRTLAARHPAHPPGPAGPQGRATGTGRMTPPAAPRPGRRPPATTPGPPHPPGPPRPSRPSRPSRRTATSACACPPSPAPAWPGRSSPTATAPSTPPCSPPPRRPETRPGRPAAPRDTRKRGCPGGRWTTSIGSPPGTVPGRQETT